MPSKCALFDTFISKAALSLRNGVESELEDSLPWREGMGMDRQLVDRGLGTKGLWRREDVGPIVLSKAT